jgi:tetratricopeptide (TPR) repeat protein
MNSLLTRVAIYCLLLFATTALAVSEEAVERNSAGAKLMEQGKLDGAIAAFRNAIGLDPKYFPARLNLAYAYEKANRLDEAIDAYREAIDTQPQNFFAHNNLGVLYDKTGLYDAAIAECERALEIEPGNSIARKNLEVAKKNKMAVEERAARIQRAEQEARAKPNDAGASYNLARTYAFHGQKDLALEWLSKARKQGYRDVEYLKVDPAFESMRNDADFERLTKP